MTGYLILTVGLAALAPGCASEELPQQDGALSSDASDVSADDASPNDASPNDASPGVAPECVWPTGYEQNTCCWKGDASYSNCQLGDLCCAPTSPDYMVDATWPQSWADFEAQVVVLVNQFRAQGYDCGGSYGYLPPAPPVAMNAALREAARRHSIDMAVNNFVGHVGTDGSTGGQRAQAAGYAGTASLENAGGGYGPWDTGPYAAVNNRNPDVMVTNWMASPGHCKTIMRANLFADSAQDVIDEVGIGYTNMNRTQDPDIFLDTMVSHRRWTLLIGASGNP